MAKKAVQEADEQQKLQTRYDRKMEKRRKQKEKEEKEEKAAKIIGRILGIAIVAALVIIVGTSVFSRVSAVKGTYIQVGDATISKLEYDYYYNSTVNSYITSYGSILPYMGLDTSADFDTQAYSDNLSWKDAFDQLNFMAEGTLNHALPVAIPAAISVLPTPVEKAPSAP